MAVRDACGMTMLLLRPLVEQDIAVYSQWGQDPVFCEHAGWTVGLPLAEHEAHWQRLVDAPGPDLIRLAAVRGDDVVGYVDLHGDRPHRRELGYVVGPAALWGHGIGTAIARLGLEHGFRRLGLEEITAGAVDANEASIRILVKLGLTETGRGAEEPFLGVPSYYRRFRITKAEWERP